MLCGDQTLDLLVVKQAPTTRLKLQYQLDNIFGIIWSDLVSEKDKPGSSLPVLHLYCPFTDWVSEARNDSKREECTISDVICGFP